MRRVGCMPLVAGRLVEHDDLCWDESMNELGVTGDPRVAYRTQLYRIGRMSDARAPAS